MSEWNDFGENSALNTAITFLFIMLFCIVVLVIGYVIFSRSKKKEEKKSEKVVASPKLRAEIAFTIGKHDMECTAYAHGENEKELAEDIHRTLEELEANGRVLKTIRISNVTYSVDEFRNRIEEK